MAGIDQLLIPYEAFEDSRFDLVGRYGCGNQFLAFVTSAIPANWSIETYPALYMRANEDRYKRWYAVLHRFDTNGNHLGTTARSGGTSYDGEGGAIRRADRHLNEMMTELGPLAFCDIWVRPFGVDIDGYFFGLVYTSIDAEDPDDPDARVEYVLLEPNDIMFHPPWDSGEYST